MAINTRSATESALGSGKLFTVGHTTPSIAAAGTYLFGLTTGPRPVEYLDRLYTASVNEALVELYENAYTGGTPAAAGNRNMVVGGPGPVNYVAAPTATITGTPVATVKLIGGSSSGTATITLYSDSERYILKPNTQYVLRLTNQDSNAGMITFRWTYRDTDVAY